MGFFSSANPFKASKSEKEAREKKYVKLFAQRDAMVEKFDCDQEKAEKWFLSLNETDKQKLKDNISPFASKLIFSRKAIREIFLYLFMVFLFIVSGTTLFFEGVIIGFAGGMLLIFNWFIFKKFDTRSKKNFIFTDPLSSAMAVALYRTIFTEDEKEDEKEDENKLLDTVKLNVDKIE